MSKNPRQNPTSGKWLFPRIYLDNHQEMKGLFSTRDESKWIGMSQSVVLVNNIPSPQSKFNRGHNFETDSIPYMIEPFRT